MEMSFVTIRARIAEDNTTDERRGAPRLPVELEAKMRELGASGIEAKVVNISERGFHVVYREHEVNHCPGCGRTHWIIGRVSAECAFCATALPLAEASMRSHNGPVVIEHKNRDANAWAA